MTNVINFFLDSSWDKDFKLDLSVEIPTIVILLFAWLCGIVDMFTAATVLLILAKIGLVLSIIAVVAVPAGKWILNYIDNTVDNNSIQK